MSREAKKKPGDLQKARKRHLLRQALSDKLRFLKINLEQNEEIWFSLENKRLRLQKFDVSTYGLPCDMLALVNNKLQLMHAPDKHSSGVGSMYLTNGNFVGWIPNKQILATVVQKYNR